MLERETVTGDIILNAIIKSIENNTEVEAGSKKKPYNALTHILSTTFFTLLYLSTISLTIYLIFHPTAYYPSP